MSLKVFERDDGEVSEGKEWKTPPWTDLRRSSRSFSRLDWLRARSATAMPPSRASTRATPAPEVGPAPMMIARVLGADMMGFSW